MIQDLSTLTRDDMKTEVLRLYKVEKLSLDTISRRTNIPLRLVANFLEFRVSSKCPFYKTTRGNSNRRAGR